MWDLIASLLVGMVLLLALNLPLAPVRARLLRVPRPYLYAGILFFAAVGAYAVGGEVVDLVILLVIGLVGLGVRCYGLPVLPAVIGVVLGSAAEQQLRRALQISDGSVTGLVDAPFAAPAARCRSCRPRSGPPRPPPAPARRAPPWPSGCPPWPRPRPRSPRAC